jgi:hypothetical protein
MEQPNYLPPFFTSTNSTVESIFTQIWEVVKDIFHFIFNTHTWSVIGEISIILSIFYIGVITFCLIKLFEIQAHEKEEVDHEIREALEKQKEKNRTENPRWHYILTLVESPNESDWRVSIIEADSMLEEVLREKGFSGTTLGEILDSAKEAGYRSIGDAWAAHDIRNKIAHEGVDYPISQVEARRVIRMYQNFFEEIQVI